MSTAEFWAGEFGNEYVKRNRVDWWKRMPFWAGVISDILPSSVIEFGTNCGWNLMAIRALQFPMAISGVEINAEAVSHTQKAGFCVVNTDILASPFSGADLTFTAGVLIHIAPEDLKATMQKIIDSSRRYVLAVEYAADKEEEVIYRGHRGVLWKRPFGKLYQDLGLRLVSEGVAEGFDQCTYWLLERQ